MVLDNAGGGDAFAVPVSGFAYEAPTVAAGALDFQSVRRGGAGVRKHALFVNTSEGSVHFGAASITGPDSGAFEVTDNGCTGKAIAPKGLCPVWVAFKPSHDGPHHAELALASDAANSPHRVPLSGTGVPEADIRLEAAALDFGIIGAPFGDVTRDITVRNVGNARGGVVPLVPALEPAAHARIVRNECFGDLAAGQSCLVSIAVTPLGPGPLGGAFQVQGRRSQAVLASIPISGIVAGDPLAFVQASLGRTLASAARAWRRAGRTALLRRGFRMAWSAPFGGTARLRVYAELPGASARGRRLIARVYDGVGPHRGDRVLRAPVTRVGRRLLTRRGRFAVVAELRFRSADGRGWTASRRVRLR